MAIASQASFADALAGGSHLAWFGGALLLSEPGSLSAAAAEELAARTGSLREVWLYGGTGALADAVRSGAAAAVGA